MKKKDAIAHFGSITKLAEALGITTQAISLWPKRIPQRRAYEIERLTGGALMVDDAPEPIQKSSQESRDCA